jgi:nicotinamide-nucleotide adenylyltransferase
MKKYKLGMYLGRFQPFHNGHKAIVDKMLEECERVLIVIGSADKYRTTQNPYYFNERRGLIKAVYPQDEVICVGIPDRPEVKNDSGWGRYVIDMLNYFGYRPNAIYQGMETERETWYKDVMIPVISISRLNIPISATLIRAAFIERDKDFIRKNCPPAVAGILECWMFIDDGGCQL